MICFVNLPGPVFCKTPEVGLFIMSSIKRPIGCCFGAEAIAQLQTLNILFPTLIPMPLNIGSSESVSASRPTIRS